jgi:2-aminoethylphosphonate dioxygenase
MAYAITPSQHAFFAKNGYLILRDVLSPIETIALQQWAQEVHDLPRTPETPWMPYEEVNAVGDRVLCRTENYANYHAKFNGLLRGDKLLGILGQLSGEEMLLFKEKSECGLSVPIPRQCSHMGIPGYGG